MGERTHHSLPMSHKYATELGVTDAGNIYSISLIAPINLLNITYPLPSEFSQYLSPGTPFGESYRRGLSTKMHHNSPNSYPLIGKPSSMYIFKDKSGTYKVDFLVESDSNIRTPQSVLHTHMVNFAGPSRRYYSPNLYTYNSLWSGHIANITPNFRDQGYTHAVLLDNFEHGREITSHWDREVIQVLHANGILPLTCDGYVLSSNHSKVMATVN